MASKYIEAKRGESWREVTRPFRSWLQIHVPDLGTFGYSEGDSLIHGDAEYACIDIPDHHGEKVALFEAWAKSTGRKYGERKGSSVHFSDGSTLGVS